MRAAEIQINPEVAEIKAEKIIRYFRALPPEQLGVENLDAIQVLGMTPGSYNLNYHVQAGGKKFIFRVNVEAQSGLPNQCEYEYRVLKFLAGHDIAPAVYHIDDTRTCFDFDILVEEFLEGRHLSLEEDRAADVGALLAKLHALPVNGMRFIIWENPLQDTFNMVDTDLVAYEQKRTADRETIHLARKLLAACRPLVATKQHLFQPHSLNHTDVVCDNFIRAPEGLRMIDWEKPRVDDVSYDVGCFLSEVAQLWCSGTVLNNRQRAEFLQAYARLRGEDPAFLQEKVKIRQPLISLHWILWGASKLCDLREDRAARALVAAHEKRARRYQNISRPEHIKKLLDALPAWA